MEHGSSPQYGCQYRLTQVPVQVQVLVQVQVTWHVVLVHGHGLYEPPL